MNQTRYFLLACILGLCAAIAIAVVALLQRTPSSPMVAHRPVEVAKDGYVGSKSCQACHPSEYAKWHDSYHRTMTQVASKKSVQGDFNDIEFSRFGRHYRLGHDAEEYWIDVEGERQDGLAARSTIQLCTGSHHMQVYWFSTGRGRELAAFPFVWLAQEQRWIPRESAFLELPSHADGYEAGRWNRSCITCHTTHGERNLNPPDPPQSTVAEFGISCEACHGPGEGHLRYHDSTTAGPRTAADPIVQPRDLPHPRDSEVCGQCHMAWHSEVRDPKLAYRPGDDLQSLRAVRKQRSQFWPDGMVRVVGREFNGLIESPCFRQGTLSCLSCHVMHQASGDERPRAEWADDQLKPGMRSNAACLSCHEDMRSENQLAAHTHHDPKSSGSLCYNCHMPNTSYGLLKASRSHLISSPTIAETTEFGRPNACNLCHLDKSLPWTDDHLVQWYGHEPSELAGPWSEVSLAIRIALAGDAGQRALIAWHMGWEPARQASDDAWFAPYLSVLMTDYYPAVRLIAHRSLNQVGGYGDIPYDSEATRDAQRNASQAIRARWQQDSKLVDQPRLLVLPTGELDADSISGLLQQRDQTAISLAE